MNIPDCDIFKFKKEGILFLPGLIREEKQDSIRAGFEKDIKSPRTFFHGYKIEGEGKFHGNMRLWESNDNFKSYCLNSKLAKIASKLTNSNKINLFYDQLFEKKPEQMRQCVGIMINPIGQSKGTMSYHFDWH